MKANRVSIQSDLLKERAVGTGLEFRDLMQADFILYILSCLDELHWEWDPITLIHSDGYNRPFEIFARSESKPHFEKSKVIWGKHGKAGLIALNEEFRSGKRRAPSWNYKRISPSSLLNMEKLATKD